MNKLTSKILIVDDNLANILLLEKMLTISGYKNIKSSTDARLTLELFSTFQPDLVLLDFRMPFMDGLEVMDQLYSSQNYCILPIIMISAENDKEYYEEALTKGAMDFITKPFNYSDIILKIDNVLQFV
jgi:CheY-like chemotaxis protein